MGLVKVISPGLFSTFQDLGRFGYQKYGLPVSGAMDEYSLRVANILVGNPQGEAALEITLLGPTLEFTEECIIALTGADLGAKLNGERIPLWQAIYVNQGDRLAFSGVKSGCRAYLALAGGFVIPKVLGSKSTYSRGKIGGYLGRSLKKGDEISYGSIPTSALELLDKKVPSSYLYDFSNPLSVRVILGPQEEAFTKAGIRTFLESSYKVTTEADRMGYRLVGPKIEHKGSPDIISDGISPGSIQIPGDGLPIIMLADRQTTGGYTKIATIISADLPKIAQAKPGDTITFQAVTIEKAHEIYKQYQEKIRLLQESLTKNKVLLPSRQMIMRVNGEEFLVEIQETTKI